MFEQQPDSISLCKKVLSSTRVKHKRQTAKTNNEKDEEDKGDKEYYEQVYPKASSVGLLKRCQENTTTKRKKTKNRY